jgi:hypothetical protein
MQRGGIGKVKGANPEKFVFLSIDVERGNTGQMKFYSELELRAALAQLGHAESEVELIINDARKQYER